MTVLLLELNEVNFDYVRGYAAQGRLPVLGGIIERHGLARTTSEARYEELEPWIQWVTAHTGLSLADHGVFRLGDIVARPELEQIWEVLERQGVTVGAISPMNANNNCRNPAFFLPDPWTRARASGGAAMHRLMEPIRQAVNDNATGRLTARSYTTLLDGFVRYARAENYTTYLGLLRDTARGRGWNKAMFLDLMLADVFVRNVHRTALGFASLFLNAGAHIQHHYMFNSAVYEGPHRNPDWYVAADADPVFDVYALYDRIVGQVARAFPTARLMIATGLHQDPYPTRTFYWRLVDHADFLADHAIPFDRVETRMSRDFVTFHSDLAAARTAEAALGRITAVDGSPLFEVDNRGDSLFVTLVWADDVDEKTVYHVDGVPRTGLRERVAFVALKNGGHNGIGYFIDTGVFAAEDETFPLSALPERIASACGVTWPSVQLQTAAE